MELTDEEWYQLSAWNFIDGARQLQWLESETVYEAVEKILDARMSRIVALLDEWRSLPVWGPDDRGLMILDDVDLGSILEQLSEAIYGPDPDKRPRVPRSKRRESSNDA